MCSVRARPMPVVPKACAARASCGESALARTAMRWWRAASAASANSAPKSPLSSASFVGSLPCWIVNSRSCMSLEWFSSVVSACSSWRYRPGIRSSSGG